MTDERLHQATLPGYEESPPCATKKTESKLIVDEHTHPAHEASSKGLATLRVRPSGLRLEIPSGCRAAGRLTIERERSVQLSLTDNWKDRGIAKRNSAVLKNSLKSNVKLVDPH